MPLNNEQKRQGARLLNEIGMLRQHMTKHVSAPFEFNEIQLGRWLQQVRIAEEHALRASNLAHEILREPDALLQRNNLLEIVQAFSQFVERVEESVEIEEGESAREAENPAADNEADGENAHDTSASPNESVKDTPGDTSESMNVESDAEDIKNETENEAPAEDEYSDEAAENIEQVDYVAEFSQMHADFLTLLDQMHETLDTWGRDGKGGVFKVLDL